MIKSTNPADRLIVAADFKPETGPVTQQILNLADKLKDTGVYIKVNSALRVYGYGLIDEIHLRGLNVFADLKLYDIRETLTTDGEILSSYMPDLLTVSCAAGPAAMAALRKTLPFTEVLGVTVLTNLDENDTSKMFDMTIADMVRRMTHTAHEAAIGGIICAPTDIATVREIVGSSMTINTPAIRPAWSIVAGDDQNPDRVMTPEKAIRAGADRIVVGRPILQAENPYDAVMRTLDEINNARTNDN